MRIDLFRVRRCAFNFTLLYSGVVRLEQILRNVGLEEDEAAIYLRCLQLGTQDVRTISKNLKLPMRSTHAVLHRLHQRGFLSRFLGDHEYFTAEAPAVVLGIIENDYHESRKRIIEFRRALKAFERSTNPASSKPEISLYQGKKGIIAAYEDTLHSTTEILAVTSIDDTETTLPTYVPMYYKRRKAAGILIRAIFTDSPLSRARQKRDKAELRVSRLVPKSFLKNFHIEYYIYDNKVAYFSVKEQLAVIVKSTVIATSMRSIFETLWRMAERFPGNQSPRGKSA